MSGPLILPLPGTEAFAARLAQAGGFDLGEVEFRRFPDGERYVRINTDPNTRSVALIGANADEQFLTLAFAAGALRDLGALDITFVAPYLGYLRQDTRFRPGEAVTSRTFARLVSTCVDRLVTVDPHLHRFHALTELYDIPCVALRAAPVIGDWIARNVTAPLVIGPDAESEQWVADIATRAGAPWAVLTKQRLGDREVKLTLPDLGAYAGRQPVLVDDIVSSGSTLVAASRSLRDHGFTAPVCVVLHPIFADDAFERVSEVATRVISTDTLVHRSNAISVAPIITEALLWARGP